MVDPTKRIIVYPYMPDEGTIDYVPASNTYMHMARELAKKYRSNLLLPGAAVIVKNGEVLGTGSIGNNPAHLKGCVRVKLNMPTGQGYELCEGCDPKYHSEPSAIRDAEANGHNVEGAELYLWGHWWCCKSCWNAMLSHGITTVHLLEDSSILFNKEAAGNIVGKQFVA